MTTSVIKESYDLAQNELQIWWHGTTDSEFKSIDAPSFKVPFFISDDPSEAMMYTNDGWNSDNSGSKLVLTVLNPKNLVTFDWCDKRDLDLLESIPDLIKDVLHKKQRSTFILISGLCEVGCFEALSEDLFDEFSIRLQMWAQKKGLYQLISDEDARSVFDWLSSARSSAELAKVRDLSEEVDCKKANNILYELFWSQLERTQFNSFHEKETSENIALCDTSSIEGIWSKTLDIQQAKELLGELRKDGFGYYNKLRQTKSIEELNTVLMELFKKTADSALLEREITEDTKLFFVGTTESKYDLAAQKFKDYKELDKISINNAAFGTSTWGYACAYAKQYAKKDDHGVVVAFELKPGLEVFDLRDENEYKTLGIPGEIADVFVDAEPYFAVNTAVPPQQAGVRPPEFVAAMMWLKDAAGKNLKTKNLIDQLAGVADNNFPNTKDDLKKQWSTLYAKQLVEVFQKVYGIKKWRELEPTLKSTKFSDINELIKLGAVQIYTPEDHQLRLKADKLKNEFLKQETGSAKTKVEPKSELEARLFKHLLDNGIPAKKDGITPKIQKTGSCLMYPTNVFAQSIPIDRPAEEWTYRFKGCSEPFVIPNLKSLPDDIQILAHNCGLLYKNPKSGQEEIDDEFDDWNYDKVSIENTKTLSKIFGYLKLFKICKDYILNLYQNPTSIQAKKFQDGINVIKERLEKDSKHLYIDYLQYVFFSLLTQSDKYIGVTCPEIRGYTHIHRWSGKHTSQTIKPYGYKNEISKSTMYYDDMTVILCKSLADSVTNLFGHVIDFIDTQDYRKRLGLDPKLKRGPKKAGYVAPIPKNQIDSDYFVELVLPEIEKCNSVAQYKEVYEKDIEPFVVAS